MKRILVATPTKSGIPSYWFHAYDELIRRKDIPYDIEFAIEDSNNAVNLARNVIAAAAVEGNYDRLVMIDRDHPWTADQLLRLLSHEEPIVGGIYCKKLGGPAKWLTIKQPGAEPDARGLLRVDSIATGFLSIKVDVFRKMAQDYPERAFVYEDEQGKAKVITEWFPIGVVGPNTAEAKLDRIRKIVGDALIDNEDALGKIVLALEETIDQPGRLLGEDYHFCHLAVKSGFPIYADMKCILKHVGDASYPIGPEQLSKPEGIAVSNVDLHQLERGEFVPPKPVEVESLWPQEFIDAGIHPRHCEDVLKGCYDVPVNMEAPIILDIGANIGAFARWACERWADPTIHCYEPYPPTFELLKKTEALLPNQETHRYPLVYLYPVAVLDRKDRMAIHNPGVTNGESTLFGAPTNCGMVDVIDAATLPDADIIKIDTEGAEPFILKRLAETGKLKGVSAIMFEWHRPDDAKTIPALLEAHGFKLHESKVHAEARGEMKFIR